MGEARWHDYWPSWMSKSSKTLFDKEINKTADRTFNALMRYLIRPEIQLYNAEQDPDNMKNLAGHPEQAAVQKKLAAVLEEWMAEQGDPGAGLDVWDVYKSQREGNHFVPDK